MGAERQTKTQAKGRGTPNPSSSPARLQADGHQIRPGAEESSYPLCIVGSIATSDCACLNALVVVCRCHLPVWFLPWLVLSCSYPSASATVTTWARRRLRAVRWRRMSLKAGSISDPIARGTLMRRPHAVTLCPTHPPACILRQRVPAPSSVTGRAHEAR